MTPLPPWSEILKLAGVDTRRVVDWGSLFSTGSRDRTDCSEIFLEISTRAAFRPCHSSPVRFPPAGETFGLRLDRGGWAQCSSARIVADADE